MRSRSARSRLARSDRRQIHDLPPNRPREGSAPQTCAAPRACRRFMVEDACPAPQQLGAGLPNRPEDGGIEELPEFVPRQRLRAATR